MLCQVYLPDRKRIGQETGAPCRVHQKKGIPRKDAFGNKPAITIYFTL